ncbi:MAG TPA: DNA-3-methyladenine glycosylase [Anaerolineales bacterium]|jgi:DNA-3-methyladenine glycosylase
MPLSTDFFAQPTLSVARQLLGARLVRSLEGERLSGIITETEAYIGETDLACHARAGKTARTLTMYGPPGRAYIYFTYGMHWLLNAVTEPEGSPAAVLIRAIRVDEGLDRVETRRPRVVRAEWTNGPAKLTQAFGIGSAQNGIDLTSTASDLHIETGVVISDANVTIGPRVGLYSVPEPWKSMPWRFLANL